MSLSLDVYARYLSGYSVEEISRELTIPEGRVPYEVLRIGIEMGCIDYYGRHEDAVDEGYYTDGCVVPTAGGSGFLT